jgi:hypothetical protein
MTQLSRNMADAKDVQMHESALSTVNVIAVP